MQMPDLMGTETGTEAGEVDQKKRKVEGRDGDKDKDKAKPKNKEKDLINVLTKLTLQNTQSIRDLQAAEYKFFLAKAASPAAAAIQAAGKSYHDKVTQLGREHKLGPPAVHQLTALIKVLMTDPSAPVEPKNIIQKYWADRVLQIPPEVLAQDVPVFRMRKTRVKEKVKIYFKLSDPVIEEAVVKCMVALGGEHRVGAAPAGELERVAQKLLEERA